MNCTEYESSLGDLVDGTSDGVTAAALEAHLAHCERCRILAGDLRAIRSAATMLERHVPPARTWQRIAAAVETDRQSRRFAWLSWRPLAAAAVVLMMASATWMVLRPSTPAVPLADLDVQSTAAHYQTAIAGLEQITSTGGSELDPMTAEVLKANLTVIDMAIDESRAALETEPANDVAQQSLFAALGTKVALLQDTVALINETRQGQNP
jgi:anti-sigma factor RsiW